MKEEGSSAGDIINFRGLVRSPMDSAGVIYLFGKVAEDLRMYVEEIRDGFPACTARRFTGQGWERVRVGFEYKSSDFGKHGHKPEGNDLIVCWEHDWEECPIETIELRTAIQDMANIPTWRAGSPAPAGKDSP